MTNKGKMSTIVFSVYIMLVFYVFGGGIVNSLVGYPTWRAVGPEEFVAFHKIDSSLIVPFFVIFAFLTLIPQILLFWFRPRVIPRSLVFLALFLNLIALISSIAIQIPIQLELSKGFSLELIDRLIDTDFKFRKIPSMLMAVINFIMLYKIVRHSSECAN